MARNLLQRSPLACPSSAWVSHVLSSPPPSPPFSEEEEKVNARPRRTRRRRRRQRNRNTHVGHFGEMASWQMRAVYGASEQAGVKEEKEEEEELVETTELLMNRWANGFTCEMCEKLAPFLKTHECKSKCSALWPFLQGTCEELCGELIKYAPTAACWEAGYCPKPV